MDRKKKTKTSKDLTDVGKFRIGLRHGIGWVRPAGSTATYRVGDSLSDEDTNDAFDQLGLKAKAGQQTQKFSERQFCLLAALALARKRLSFSDSVEEVGNDALGLPIKAICRLVRGWHGQVESASAAMRREFDQGGEINWRDGVAWIVREHDEIWIDDARALESYLASASSPIDPPRTPSDDLLARVLEIFRLREEHRGRSVHVDLKTAPRGARGERFNPLAADPDAEMPVSYFIEHALVTAVDEGEAQSHLVAAALTPPSGMLTRFVEEVVTPFRQRERYGRVLFVHGGHPGSPDDLKAARQADVKVASLAEFQGILDPEFEKFVARQTDRLARDHQYEKTMYVEQRLAMVGGDIALPGDDALANLEEWLAYEHARFVLVIGDFGTGKTFLLRELARRMGERKRPPWPVLIQMRALSKYQHLEQLLAAHLPLGGMERIDLPAIRRMREDGRITLLFDGFDELVSRTNYQNAADHLETVLQAVVGDAKVVLTSRSQHFLNETQVVNEVERKTWQVFSLDPLGRRAAIPGSRIARLQPFDADQIRKFLLKKLKDGEAAESRYSLIEGINNLVGLSHNPRMLSFVAELPAHRLEAARTPQGEITAAHLYRELLDHWLHEEEKRATVPGGVVALTKVQRWVVVRAVAEETWARGRSLQLEELHEVVRRSIPDLPGELDVAAHQVGSGTLLSHHDEGGFRFVHESVLEWLVASTAAEQVAVGATIFTAGDITELMADFFVQLSNGDSALSWARATLRDPLANDRQKRNAMRVLRRFGGEDIANVSFGGGRDLRGERFAGQRLPEGDFTGADLTRANFADADLTRAKFVNARLVTADLTRAILEDANLEGADLSFARLPGANLRGASMLRARMRYAKLVGATLDPHSLDGCDATGSALPDLSEPVPILATPYHFFIGVVFSSDGALCVTLWDGRVFETRTRFELCRVPGVRKTVAFSEKGDTLLLANSQGEVKFWDLVAGKVLRTVQGPAEEGRSGNFTWRYACAIALHPASMVGATQVHDGTVHIWNLQSGAVERIFPPVSPATRHIHEDGTRVVFNHDGSLLAAAHEGGEVCLWDTRTGEAKGVLKSGGGRILGIGFDSDGRRLFSVSDMDESVFVYDMAPLGLLRRFKSHLVECAAISPNGAMVGSVSNNGDVEVWDVEAGESLWRKNVGGSGGFSCIAFSPDSTSLVTSSSGKLLWWSAATGESAPLGRSGVSSHVAGLAAKDASIITGSGDGAVSIWDFRRPGPLITRRQYDNWIEDLACAGNGSIACAYGWRHDSAWQCVLEVLDSELRVRWSHVRRSGSGCFLRFSPDSRFLADCRFSEGMRLCSAADGTEVWALPNQDSNTSNYGGLAFLPDGQSIIWGRGKNLVMLDLATGRTLRDLHSFSEVIGSVAADHRGERIAAVAGNQLICVEVATGAEWKVQVGLDQSGGRTRHLLEFSPDGRLLLRGYGAEARVWRVGDDQPLCILGNEGHITSLAFVEGGSLVATGSEDGGVRLWDVVSGQLRGTVFSAADGWATFTPSGRYSAQGDLAGLFWLRIGLVRFEPGELDDFIPGLRMGDSESIVQLR